MEHLWETEENLNILQEAKLSPQSIVFSLKILLFCRTDVDFWHCQVIWDIKKSGYNGMTGCHCHWMWHPTVIHSGFQIFKAPLLNVTLCRLNKNNFKSCSFHKGLHSFSHFMWKAEVFPLVRVWRVSVLSFCSLLKSRWLSVISSKC